MNINEVLKEQTPFAMSEAKKFVANSMGLFSEEDIPAFMAGFLAHVVIVNKEGIVK